MQCLACRLDNPPGARFCNGCGGALERICGGCGRANGPDARFCNACGGSLSPTGVVDHGAAVAPAPREGERRQLTVLFCDMVGSTELAARLDPEDWYAIAAQYQRCGAVALERFGGHVAQFLGDGFFAYFGYPVAHDDAPERGVRAGLAILDAMVDLNAQLDQEHGLRLAVRIGIHTGEVVLGEGGGTATEVFGEPVHVAARVQQLAGPDEVVITDATCRLVQGLFLLAERGAHRLRGIAHRTTLYRVLQPSGARGRLRATATHGLSPFVGREAERSLLCSRWERARDGHGQVVLISGEPGIGKSRLLQVFRDDIAGSAQTWIECATSPYHEQTPFFCVTDMLQRGLAERCGNSAEEQLAMLERTLAACGLDPAEAVPLIAEMIGLATPAERYPPVVGSPAEQRRRLMTTLLQWTLGAAAIRPVVVVVEDLMWTDPSTVELLDLLVLQTAMAPVLLLCTARPEFRGTWAPRSNVLTITLNRLSQQQVRQMVAADSDALLETLVERSDGVPLFAEELARLMRDVTGRFGQSEIPMTLQDLLAARLDRLGSARRIAQIGAVIGREFPYDLLAAVAGAVVPDLDAALTRLTNAELLHARGLPPNATYVFKHALIRDAAYGSLLKARRRELHLAIARTLAGRSPDVPAELLAHHYTEAGELESAWREWRRAGERAVAHSALREAPAHFTTALRLLAELPDAPGRAQHALELHVLLGQALAATKGYGASEVTAAFARARELAHHVGATPEIRSVLFGLWASIAGQGGLDVADELADELLAVAQRAGARDEPVWGHLAHGINQYSRGNGLAARDHLARVATLYRQSAHPASLSDPGVMSLSYATVNSWMLGLVDEARALSHESLALARELRNPFAEAWAGFFTGALHVFLREPDRALGHTDPLLVLCREHDFPLFVGLVTIVRGAALSESGRHEEGCSELRRGLELFLATGQRVAHRLYLSWMAQALAAAGATDDAMATVEEALAKAPDERLFEPELHRVRAELLVRRGADPARIEASYHEAIDLAHRQAARSLELRAVSSWALWRRGGGGFAEARHRLGEICAVFPPGLDTRDLREARAVLPADERPGGPQ